jgi:hypothetical protein
MSNKKILQGHNKALESLATIAGIQIKEKINPELFGCTKFEKGTFTPSSAVTSATINHSLDVKPKISIVRAKGNPTDTTLMAITEYSLTTAGRGAKILELTDGDVIGNLVPSGLISSTTQVSFVTNNWGFKQGVEYEYILMA